MGTGVRIATASVRTGLAMTVFCKKCGTAGGQRRPPLRMVARSACVRADVGSELSAAGGRGSEVSEWPRSKFSASAVRQRGNFGHRNRVIGPYESVTRSVTSIGRADVGIGPYGENLGRAKEKNKRIPKYPLAFDRSEELEVLDDVNDFGTDALLSLQGGGADMSGRLENVPVAHF